MLDELRRHKPWSLDVNWAQDPFSPLPAFVDTGAPLITKENVGDFMKARDARRHKGFALEIPVETGFGRGDTETRRSAYAAGLI